MILVATDEQTSRQIEKMALEDRKLPEGYTNGLCVKNYKEDKWAFLIDPKNHSEELVAQMKELDVVVLDEKEIPMSYSKFNFQ